MNIMVTTRPPPAFRKGYALCSPDNVLQPDSFGNTEKKAIASAYKKKGRKKAWALAMEEGWTVRLVYMRLFVPVFYSTSSETQEFEED